MNEVISAFLAGIPTFILSILVVFVMLELLIGAIFLLGKVVGFFTNKLQKAKNVEAEVVTTTEEVSLVAQHNSLDELELIAVITAVIAASMGTTSDQLQVKSLRKVQRKAL